MTTNDHDLVALGQASAHARRACERLDRIGGALSTAIQRAMPWLVRKKVEVRVNPARAATSSELFSALALPHHVTTLEVNDKHEAMLVLDGVALARGVDGVLGGGSGELPRLAPTGLSAAQNAIASRLAESLVGPLTGALSAAGLTLTKASATSPRQASGLFVMLSLTVGDDANAGSVAIIVPAAAISVPAAPAASSETTAAALTAVELDVVAELGRVALPLTRVAGLKVGDVLRLPLGPEDLANVQVGGRELFVGKPIAHGNQIAIEIVRHDP